MDEAWRRHPARRVPVRAQEASLRVDAPSTCLHPLRNAPRNAQTRENGARRVAIAVSIVVEVHQDEPPRVNLELSRTDLRVWRGRATKHSS